MTDETDLQTIAESDRAERERLDADIAAALARHGVLMVDCRPGFAARRRDRMLRVRQTRKG